MIMPRTGERVKKAFTLRRNRTTSNGSADFLLAPGRADASRHGEQSLGEKLKARFDQAYTFAVSPTGLSILKCSLAYILGSLATFIGPISGLLGRNDGKHMVATVTVYFHPARSAGSMAEAILVAYTAVIYAALLSFTSMAVSILFAKHHLLVLGHVFVLVIFCGGGLGLVGWTKQRLGNPLVNVACSLASLVFITVLTKEGAVQAATFSYNKVWQVLKMVLMGTVASTAVSLLIRPTWARKEFRDSFIKSTDAMSEMLGIITQSFLSGSELDLKDDAYIKASNQSRAVFKTLVKNLSEAKYEHYILGTAEEHKIETRLVKCLELLNQNIGGLRSAVETQFTLLSQPDQIHNGLGMPSPSKPLANLFGDRSPSPVLSPALSHMERRTSILASIDEVPETSGDVPDNESVRMSGGSWRLPHEMESHLTATDMFSIFIAHLGPPMVGQARLS